MIIVALIGCCAAAAAAAYGIVTAIRLDHSERVDTAADARYSDIIESWRAAPNSTS